MTIHERMFFQRLQQLGIERPEREYRFTPFRRWRFDYAWPYKMVAMEIEGGAWCYGRHNRASGFIKDMEKYTEAAILGWRVLRITPEKLPLAAESVLRAINKGGNF
jgi:very-short-patch-repair endonuclease